MGNHLKVTSGAMGRNPAASQCTGEAGLARGRKGILPQPGQKGLTAYNTVANWPGCGGPGTVGLA
jgi:hypothetical protein